MGEYPLPGCWVHPKAHPVVDDKGRVIGATLLVRGHGVNQHVDAMRRAIPAIAKAYRTLPEGVVIEPFRDDFGQATIQIVSGVYLREQAKARETRMRSRHPWTGPSLDPETGIGQIMVGENGAPGLYRHYEPGVGGYHGWMVGPTRRGKSVAMSAVLLDVTAHGIAYPVLLDMGPKPSLQEWDWHEAYTRDFASACLWLARVDAELIRRGKVMEQRRLRVLDPSPEFPQIPVNIDEAPQLLPNTEAMTIVKRVAMVGAAMNVVIRYGSQPADYADAFGYIGGTTLRSQVQAGNVLVFASEDDLISKALDGSPAPVKPWRIPRDIKGAALLYGNEHPMPLLGRTIVPEDPDRANRQWVRLPDYALPELTAQAEDHAHETAATTERALSGCREAVWDRFDVIEPGEALDAASVLTALTPRWSRSSVYAALGTLANDQLIRKGDKGKWVRL